MNKLDYIKRNYKAIQSESKNGLISTKVLADYELVMIYRNFIKEHGETKAKGIAAVVAGVSDKTVYRAIQDMKGTWR